MEDNLKGTGEEKKRAQDEKDRKRRKEVVKRVEEFCVYGGLL